MFRLLVFAAGLAISECSASWGADICRAIALHDVPSIEDPSSFLKRGDIDTAITQYRVDKKSGQTSFCSHGGYCYPAAISQNGQTVEFLQLINCTIGEEDTSFPDDDYRYFSVDVVRSKNPSVTLEYDDLDNMLIQLGLCNACASNVAEMFVKHPSSQCADLTRQALQGDSEALTTLQNTPDFCLP